tara:strand:+ start:274 stop:474 length:201 start_codon:yes stop_codon:yes gene_type:complete
MSATPRTTRLREELEKDWASRSSYEESQANYEVMARHAEQLERELISADAQAVYWYDKIGKSGGAK